MARSGLASSQSCHRGVFMVLTAGSIFALMVMTALAVDLSFLYLSKRRWDRIAQAACLAALEQYLLTDESQVQDDPDPFAQKREAARLRAQGLIGFNTLAYRPLASGGNLQNALLVRQSDGSHGANGYVEFGRWNFEDSEFERAENLDDPVYAVNLAINLANESPLQGFFSKMISQGEFWLRAASTCSVTPRHMEIAFDLSRSMVGITHRPWEASPIPFNPNEVPTQQIVTQYSPAEFFYPVYSNYDTDRWNDITIEPLTNIDQWPPTNYCNNIQPSMPAGVNILPSNTSVGPDNPLFVRVGSPNQPLPSQSTQDDDVSMLCPLAWWRQGLFDPTPGLIYHHMRWNRNRGSTEEKNDPAIHFMTDYKSISVRLRRCGSYVAMRECYQACDQSADHETLFDCLFDNPSCQPTSAAACSSAGAAGLIDTGWAHMGRSPRTYGPRPLTDVYIGVHDLLETFRERSVVGDLVGMTGFDDSAFYPQRVIDLSPPEMPEPGQRTNFGDMWTLTNIGNSYDHLGQGLQSRFRAFFPVSTGGTNVGLAIRNGIMKLADAPGGAEAEASIIMVSDFITTCFNGTADGADPLGGLVTEPPESASPFCGRQAEYYLRAQQELTNIVREYLVPQKIRVHAAIVGSHVAPHNLLVRGAQGCMDSREARLAHPNEYVDTPSTGNPQDELDDMYRTPFVRANEFYSRVVAPTNGLWMPLRPPCGAAGSTALTDLRNAVSSACQNDNLQVGDRLDSVDGAIGELQSNISALGFNPAQVVDSSGRLLCDLEGRGMDQQMREYMDTIMRDNTLYLVG